MKYVKISQHQSKSVNITQNQSTSSNFNSKTSKICPPPERSSEEGHRPGELEGFAQGQEEQQSKGHWLHHQGLPPEVSLRRKL
jgi:hypothetical protein